MRFSLKIACALLIWHGNGGLHHRRDKYQYHHHHIVTLQHNYVEFGVLCDLAPPQVLNATPLLS